jgi:molybdopterin converting factor small subunit
MQVTIQYSGQLKLAVGLADERLELPEGATLEELVRELAERHDNGARRFFVDEAGAPQPTLMLVVNNRQVPAGTRQALADGDEVMLLQPISGG